MSEKSCWYSLRKHWQFVHFVFNGNKIVCIHVKALDSSLLLTDVKDVCTFFFISGTRYSLGKNVKHCQFSRAGRKVTKFYIQPKNCGICSNSSLFFISNGLILSQQ